MFKVLLVNFSDIVGGAAQATHRLHVGLLNEGILSSFYVSRQKSDSPSVVGPKTLREKINGIIGPTFDRLPQQIRFITPNAIFSNNIASDTWLQCLNDIKPDILHLHWINGGFIKIESLSQIQIPIVWTMHDQWPFTGGCHYSGECNRFNEECGCCPVLNSDNEYDLSYKNLLRKKSSWNKLNIVVVSPSTWLANIAKESTLFKGRTIKVIPNGIDTHIFKPGKINNLRAKLNLPLDKKIILYSASKGDDNRKGGFLLSEAMNYLVKELTPDKFCILLLGSTDLFRQFPADIQVIAPGIIDNETLMAQYYSASDVYVTPSKEDNLPNTVLESLASGTPVVAFDIGGMSDMIDHKQNGFLVKPFDIEQLAYGIEWGIDNNLTFDLSHNAREKVEDKFSSEVSAKQYIDLYQNLVLLP